MKRHSQPPAFFSNLVKMPSLTQAESQFDGEQAMKVEPNALLPSLEDLIAKYGDAVSNKSLPIPSWFDYILSPLCQTAKFALLLLLNGERLVQHG